ncbi:Biotin-protein ligase, N terminal [Desulfacinum hydrothermale DSM 13146]|uniref:Biotin-protein ligase, N terminal n=1 Tax=Desulfacinum hydrothermale DSM 13146 TaxID=1121390 RepID=A0A1W1XSE8_9BACT|nr:BPL-N domain-containing protein [Desulfacinum hydrothermale]SMC26772.1 Biotin-protein ligase, N terminal [Desulfacinum hydrothermale DSM 13146]
MIDTRRTPVALFWDQSLVWGLLFVDTFRCLDVPFRLVTASQIRRGILERFSVLVVPGGWATHKAQALDREGREAVRRFVEGGGAYLGICGGAGLALSSPSSLGLTSVGRKPLAERLPNVSGGVWVQGRSEHPCWRDLPPQIPVSIWWPSQFAVSDPASVEILAAYHGPAEDFQVADLRYADVQAHEGDWDAWEADYGIALNPKRLLGEPAIVTAPLGRGRIILSYPHLETPGCAWGNRLLLNMLEWVATARSGACPPGPGEPPMDGASWGPPGESALESVQRAHQDAQSLIAFGERNLLWRWRRPWLLQWQRGLRGLEYGSLAVCLRFLLEEMEKLRGKGDPDPAWDGPSRKLAERTHIFCRKAKRLLLEERAAGQNRSLSKLQSVNPTVDGLRKELFGRNMSHEGLSRSLFQILDHLLYRALAGSVLF